MRKQSQLFSPSTASNTKRRNHFRRHPYPLRQSQFSRYFRLGNFVAPVACAGWPVLKVERNRFGLFWGRRDVCRPQNKFCGRQIFWNGGLVQLLQVGALVVEVQDGVVGDAFGGHAARAHLAHADAVTVPATGEGHLKNIAVGVALEVDGEIG